ncbi:carbohydrate kinase [Kocuria sp. JC486]|uniref:carbohydrate kinase family protein n=1 Tax=Kocuria sp. JC486 TaxID=1970736 RepID=UPI0014246591|nr:carbohydrate kinase [Kocuria sp. JC486]NHU85797.1 carbohydrate kinase [Kocuria sp. JC486]
MLTVIGEALIDVVSRPDQDPVRHPGGSPMNVALGLARLGHPVRFLGAWGDDDDGRLLHQHLSAEGVELPLPTHDSATSVAEARIAENGSADYDFSMTWEFPVEQAELEAMVGNSTALHVGSIATVLEPGSANVVKAVKAAAGNVLVTYDPNCRPQITQDVDEVRERAELLAGQADVIKASDEDLQWLYPTSTLQESARAWHRSGAKLVVVTRGELGPWAINAATAPEGVEVPARRTDVVDTVGAGDTFMAALISQLVDLGLDGAEGADKIGDLDESQIAALLRRAADAAAITVSRAGADLPRREELDALGESEGATRP